MEISTENFVWLIRKWKISRPGIAAMMGMSVATFQGKFSENQPYYFTEQELKKVTKLMQDLKADLNKF